MATTTSTNGTYEYHVVFWHPTGFGSDTYTIDRPITDGDLLGKIRQHIIDNSGVTDAVITSFQLLSGPDREREFLNGLHRQLREAAAWAGRQLDDDAANPRLLAEHLSRELRCASAELNRHLTHS